MIKKPGITNGKITPLKVKWTEIGLFVLLLCFSSLGLVTTNQWDDRNKSDRLINISVLSKTAANYSAELPTYRLAHVKMSIIGEMIRDSQPNPEDLTARLAAVASLINSPIPNSSPSINPPIEFSSLGEPIPQKTVEPNNEKIKEPKIEKSKEEKIEKTKEIKVEKTKEAKVEIPNAPDTEKPEKLENPEKQEDSDKPQAPEKKSKEKK